MKNYFSKNHSVAIGKHKKWAKKKYSFDKRCNCVKAC